jgi:hypothetical protein
MVRRVVGVARSLANYVMYFEKSCSNVAMARILSSLHSSLLNNVMFSITALAHLRSPGVVESSTQNRMASRSISQDCLLMIEG